MYCLRKYIAGDVVDVYKLHKPNKTVKGQKRNAKANSTPEDVKAYNLQTSYDNATRKVNENFRKGDYHLTLTFKRHMRPKTPVEVRKILKKLFDKARKAYKKRGLEFKFFYTYGKLDKDGASENANHNDTAPHFHLIVNKIDLEVWIDLWSEYGKAFCSPLYGKNFSGLVKYLIEHTKHNIRNEKFPMSVSFSCSRNFRKPKKLKDEIINASSWRKNPQAPSGYYLDKDSLRVGVSAVTGYPYQFYRLIKLDERR